MLINGRYMTRSLTGVERFAQELVGAFSQIRPAGFAKLVVPQKATVVNQSPAGIPVSHAGEGSGHYWEQVSLARMAPKELLVNLCNTAPVLRERQLVVVHDAASMVNPQNYGLAFRSWYRTMINAVARRARVLATVSSFSADELKRVMNLRSRQIEIVSEGGEHILREPADTSILDKHGLAGRRFVLALGSAAANKNLVALVQAMRLVDDPELLVVAAGGHNNRIFADASISDPRLISTGYVTDAQIRALFEAALCFVFPSFYEGFGLPPLEAMYCGCPVIVSNRASLPEVCGDAALYCDPSDPRTIADQIRVLLESESARREYSQAGRERAARFTWAGAAQQFDSIVKASLH